MGLNIFHFPDSSTTTRSTLKYLTQIQPDADIEQSGSNWWTGGVSGDKDEARIQFAEDQGDDDDNGVFECAAQ